MLFIGNLCSLLMQKENLLKKVSFPKKSYNVKMDKAIYKNLLTLGGSWKPGKVGNITVNSYLIFNLRKT